LDYRFKADEWKNLPTTERLRRCRLLAKESQELADSAASDAIRECYLYLAMEWLQLADCLDKRGRDS
jgi:hypothetical protein